ncbi:GNAT family N-acetyltransferase [Haloglycomyces albus]|uniref:GNAT family N-acetyltransferase n=1 Tax=Haloglycomyces albus TaxID=526067 RepID=UPI000688B3C2|nr:GNAT family N-acetyltransferase [Haloglycomyces albus]
MNDSHLVMRAEPYSNPLVQQMCQEIQELYMHRYGGDGDESPIDPTDFDPPKGMFLVAHDGDGNAVGCGAWKTVDETTVEFKRIYIREFARRRGYAEIIMDELERTSRESGFKRAILFTGPQQPEAIAMYEKLGYEAITPFGAYADEPGTVHVGKSLD